MAIELLAKYTYASGGPLGSSINIGITILSLILVYHLIEFWRKLKSVRYISGWRFLFTPFSIPGVLLPVSWWNPSYKSHWKYRFNLYSYYGRDIISFVPFCSGIPTIWTSDLSVMRQIVGGGGSQSVWFKPEFASKAVLFWGMNLIAADGGETWRRHRRIMGPAFNQELYTQVWNSTISIYRDMVSSEGWNEKKTVNVSTVQDFSHKFALSVLISCGFGAPFSWSEGSKTSAMSIQEALRINTVTANLRLFVPKWILRWLPIKLFKDMKIAFRVQDAFMREKIQTRRAEIRQDVEAAKDRRDVFSRLVYANEVASEKYPLDDNELIGNINALLVAGHETTGHTLAVTLGLLGLYQEEQELVYKSIIDVIGYDREPTFKDYPALNKVLAIFYESGRLYPAAHLEFREAREDVVVSIPRGRNGDIYDNVAFDKGTTFVIDVVGLCYNPKYFPEPNEFRPSRWWTDDPSGEPEGVTIFSIGPRTCIGKKFATTESVAFLTAFLRDWHVDVDLQPGETREDWRTRVMQANIMLTLQVNPVPIRLTRRKPAVK